MSIRETFVTHVEAREYILDYEGILLALAVKGKGQLPPYIRTYRLSENLEPRYIPDEEREGVRIFLLEQRELKDYLGTEWPHIIFD